MLEASALDLSERERPRYLGESVARRQLKRIGAQRIDACRSMPSQSIDTVYRDNDGPLISLIVYSAPSLSEATIRMRKGTVPRATTDPLRFKTTRWDWSCSGE